MNEMTVEQMREELERLQAENSQLKQKKEPPFTLRVGKKGGCSAYGLGRFPVTLYVSQWVRLLDHADEIRAFLVENEDKLAKKE